MLTLRQYGVFLVNIAIRHRTLTSKFKLNYDVEYFDKIVDRNDLELQRLTLVRKQFKQAFLKNTTQMQIERTIRILVHRFSRIC